MRFWCVASIVCSFSATPSAWAQYKGDNFRDIKWLGRGGAGIALVDDGTSVFHNPAGLYFRDRYTFHFADFSLGGNQNLQTSVQEIGSLTSGDGTLSEKFAPFLGLPMNLQGSFFPHLAVPGFLFGGWDYLSSSVQYRDPVIPRLEVDFRNDFGLITGFAFGTHQVGFGASVRYIRRRSVFEDLSASSLLEGVALLNALQAKGEGWGFNLGFQARHNQGIHHYGFGIAVEDVRGTKFRSKNISIPAPLKQESQLNLGGVYSLKSSAAEARVLLDVKRVLDAELSNTKKVHLGLEVDLPATEVRLGIFQGYWTAGLTVHVLPLLQLDLVTYGEEFGASSGQSVNRFYLIGMTLGMELKKEAGKKRRKISLKDF